MKDHVIIYRLRFHDLDPVFQAFYKAAQLLGFGELRDCVFVRDERIDIGKVIENHNPPYQVSLFDSQKPLSERWERLLQIYRERLHVKLCLIRISEGEPSFFQVEKEEGWQFRAGA